MHAAREWAGSTETGKAALGIICSAAGEWANDTESSEAAVEVRQEMKQQEVIEKLGAVNEKDEKSGVVEGKAFLQNEAQLDGMTPLEYGSSGAGESSK